LKNPKFLHQKVRTPTSEDPLTADVFYGQPPYDFRKQLIQVKFIHAMAVVTLTKSIRLKVISRSRFYRDFR